LYSGHGSGFAMGFGSTGAGLMNVRVSPFCMTVSTMTAPLDSVVSIVFMFSFRVIGPSRRFDLI